jgi:hypothetical protein
MSALVQKYIELISFFENGEITAIEFDSKFHSLFISESGDLSESDYGVFNELWYVVEDFCEFPEARDQGDPDEKDLLASAKLAKDNLNKQREH